MSGCSVHTLGVCSLAPDLIQFYVARIHGERVKKTEMWMTFMNKEINALVWSSKCGRNSGLFSYVYSTSSLVMMRDAVEFPFLLHFACPTYSSLMIMGVAPCKPTALTVRCVTPGWAVNSSSAQRLGPG